MGIRKRSSENVNPLSAEVETKDDAALLKSGGNVDTKSVTSKMAIQHLELC